MKRVFVILLVYVLAIQSFNAISQVSQWSVFEQSYKVKTSGNQFTDIKLTAEFSNCNKVVKVGGFYDGNDNFRIRFMPEKLGNWTFVTESNIDGLDNKSGSFSCVPPAGNVHGPVHVKDTFDFSYADSTPYYPVGTTCYQWVFQGNPEQTLETLSKNSFNKIRMCVFPKNYDVYINNEPPLYPFEGSREKGWDFDRFNPAYFRMLEDNIGKLRDLGIEADLIIFHPYDWGKWGFDKMQQDKRVQYVKYLVARLAAYRNIWWSLANEFEYLGFSNSEWEEIFLTIKNSDPYQHLRSIHNGEHWYDVSKPYITHLSVQTTDFFDIQDWREKYRKPVIIDECVYEGDIPTDWGNLSAEEMTSRFWQVYCRGGYCTHGETYLHPENVLWWSKGGILHGQSQSRIAFLRKIMEDRPLSGVVPFHNLWNKEMYLFKPGEYYLYYYGNTQQRLARFNLPENVKFKIEIIDTWNMTIDPVVGTFSGFTEIKMPGRPWIAVRIVITNTA